jgi:hypothetical protein
VLRTLTEPEIEEDFEAVKERPQLAATSSLNEGLQKLDGVADIFLELQYIMDMFPKFNTR